MTTTPLNRSASHEANNYTTTTTTTKSCSGSAGKFPRWSGQTPSKGNEQLASIEKPRLYMVRFNAERKQMNMLPLQLHGSLTQAVNAWSKC